MEAADDSSPLRDLIFQLESQYDHVQQLADKLKAHMEQLKSSYATGNYAANNPDATLSVTGKGQNFYSRSPSREFPSQPARDMQLLTNLETFKDKVKACTTGLQQLEQSLAEQIKDIRLEQTHTNRAATNSTNHVLRKSKWPLSAEEYKRYGRQLVLPEVGIQGQLRLRASSVLIIGAGGLGCPAAAYLAGAGVGHIGIVDGDTVEASNLHRQILHSTAKVGMSKVDSAIEYIKSLNPLVRATPHRDPITPQTALDLISRYDLILDCTDNPATRYLISDACVLASKPLVSASALRTDGQLMVLNYPPSPAGDITGGPCYRCVFPVPPPPETVVSCGEGGILGPVVGVMGVLQALEAIKLVVAGLDPADGRIPAGAETMSGAGERQARQPSLLVFSANSMPAFRHIKLRRRRANCVACSVTASITSESLTQGSLDYVQFCGVVAPVKLLAPEERISATGYNNQYLNAGIEKNGPNREPSATMNGTKVTRDEEQRQAMVEILQEKCHGREPILLDVRPREHFDLYSISGSINIPYTELSRWTSANDLPDKLSVSAQIGEDHETAPIYVLCAQGNDSQHAVRKLKELEAHRDGKRFVGDIEGGWTALRKLDKDQTQHEWPDI